MDKFFQWATILSPIVAVLLAWWTASRSSKDTAKKIAATEETTTNIIKLARLQAELTSIKLDMEIWEAHFNLHKISGQTGNVLEDNRAIRQEINDVSTKNLNEEEKKRHQELEYYNNQLSNLEGHIQSFEDVKKKLGLL